MTHPGYVAPAAPGWWVRSNRVGVNTTGYDWAVSATGGRESQGTAAAGAYDWAGTAAGVMGVIFGVSGAASSGSTGNPVTFTHVGTNGDLVIVDVAVDRLSGVVASYDGVAMKYLGRIIYPSTTGAGSSAVLSKFLIPITAGNAGSKTVSVTNPAGGWITAQSTSYTRALAAGIARFANGSGTSLSQAVTCPPVGMVEQVFAAGGNSTITHTGGTSRYLFATGFQPMGIRDTAASVTFGGTISTSLPWVGGALTLYPTVPAGPQFDTSGGYTSTNVGAGAVPFTGPVVTAGADVFVDIMSDRAITLSAVTYNAVTMTLLNSVSFTGASGNAILSRYRATGVAGGAKTVSFTVSAGSPWVSASVASFTNVTSVATTATTSGVGTAPSQAVTCAANELIVQSFGLVNAMTSNTGFTGGGASMWDSSLGLGGTYLNIADVSTTFGQTATNNWGGLATVIS